MPEPILLLRLEGPLQAWGSRARWDVRDTQPEPTKSGIVGLLGCALGYGRGDPRLETELDGGLRFGVRVEEPGRILEDYQTITDFLPTAGGSYKHGGQGTASLQTLRGNPDATPATILSPRFYLEDAAFLVALAAAGTQPDLLKRCAIALQDPVWPLFLGRKACIPTRPIYEALTEGYNGLEEAITHHPWSWLGAKGTTRKFKPGGRRVYIEDETGSIRRQDAMRINPARVYGFRNVREFLADAAPVDAGKGSAQ